MSTMRALLLAGLLCLSVASPIHPTSQSNKRAEVHENNANNIFNSVIDSLRQFGSSLHLNGMSFFIAHIPQGTALYHGSPNLTSPTGFEWLAFEPEHSLLFPRFFQQMGPGRMPGNSFKGPSALDQQSLNPGSNDVETTKSDKDLEDGYLHTYQPKHDLRVVYVDGQSAAKWPYGVFDSQDKVLLDAASGYPPPNIIMDENPRMELICEMAAKQWGGKIHGILRMEAGFELVSCSFEDQLELVNVNRISTGYEYEWFYGDAMGYLKSIATRHDGIGSHRVSLDYDTMVSTYAYGDMVFADEYGRPRINNQTDWVNAARADLRAAILDDTFKSKHNWQAIADMYVIRYTDKIEYLATASDIAVVHHFAHAAMRPFIDTRHRDRKTEIHKCTIQNLPYDVLPVTKDSVVAAQAIYKVAHRVCTVMTDLQDVHDTEEVASQMKALQSWLDWASFKKCRGCGPDEFCSVPLFPLAGYSEDLVRPRCRSSTEVLWDERNFWYSPDWKEILRDWVSPRPFIGNHTDRHW